MINLQKMVFEKEIKGVLVFCSQITLNHKLKDGRRIDNRYCYWSMKRIPLTKVDRIYFAVRGKVKGYFKISEITDYEMRFHSEDWVEIENGKAYKSSRGWMYYRE